MNDEPAKPKTALQARLRSQATTVGELMSPPVGIFSRELTVAETIEKLREMTREAFITYGYVVDEAGRLEGVIVMRDLLLAPPECRLEELMLRDIFALREDMPLADGLKAALVKHFPVYPVIDG